MLNDLPRLPPMGAVIERDGPIVRTHYGTHGEVTHDPLPDGDLAALVARQVEAFARRNEPVVWPVYGDTRLAEALLAAGFTAEPERALLSCPIGTDTTPLPGVGHDWAGHRRVAELAAETGPHRRPYAEFLADAAHLDRSSEVVLDGDRAAWLEELGDCMVVGGITDPGFAATVAGHDWGRPGARFLLAEASGALRDALEAAGMRVRTTVTRYHLPSSGEPARTRPVRRLFSEPEHDEIWDRFSEKFGFRPDTRSFPGITEPPGSATWHVGDLEDAQLDALYDIVHKGLRESVEPGEELYWLDWHHAGYRFDPARVDGTGPRWPGAVFPDGDYCLYLTADLRLGTFGHPWEATVCVFGELLTRTGPELTAALGKPVRRSEP
ncbi:hypothetical protein Amsp01_016510 [Amycolatopsis sp. NBRC 101858]|uniref:DUF2716 domain-containing protein n=1 Tax=Amycolatopsis sp. NBRC 101858 TaxID=3032200 RepID=UPI0024A15D37|nr:DUF2716 domain-containing protein [Amycolatopsis sp. NBRC 101858]GLY35627.1 hypothetical protein Amsp01_016510 [Amycolatopsis sp. NBRC 101858]